MLGYVPSLDILLSVIEANCVNKVLKFNEAEHISKSVHLIVFLLYFFFEQMQLNCRLVNSNICHVNVRSVQ